MAKVMHMAGEVPEAVRAAEAGAEWSSWRRVRKPDPKIQSFAAKR